MADARPLRVYFAEQDTHKHAPDNTFVVRVWDSQKSYDDGHAPIGSAAGFTDQEACVKWARNMFPGSEALTKLPKSIEG
jgi:hypothetical protein